MNPDAPGHGAGPDGTDAADAADGRGGSDDDRPVVVLVHGLGSDSSYWDNLVGELERAYRVLAVDLPGHGPRSAPLRDEQARPDALARTLVDQLRRHGVERPHLVGLSLGGWVVLEMAALGFGASVVALAPAGLWGDGITVRGERIEAALHWLLAPLGPLLPVLTRLSLARAIGLGRFVVHPEQVTHRQFLAATRALRQARGYLACDRGLRGRFERAADVAVPATVAFGSHDAVLPAATSRERGLAPPDAIWVEVPDCGHAMSWDRPAECVELIHAAIAKADDR